MRDPDLMLSLLKEMEESPIGRIHMGSRGRDDMIRFHHAELLVDGGHVEWCNDPKSMLRITKDGYDFSESVARYPEAKNTFQDLLNKGAPYLKAVERAMDIALKLQGLNG